MNRQAVTSYGEISSRSKLNSEDHLTRSVSRWTTSLVVSLVLAGVSAIIAIIFWSGAFLNEPVRDRWTGTAGSLLMLSAFGFLVAAAHCLDRLGEIKKCRKREYCRRTGLRDDDGEWIN